MRELRSRWENEENFAADHLQNGVKDWCAENEIGFGKNHGPSALKHGWLTSRTGFISVD